MGGGGGEGKELGVLDVLKSGIRSLRDFVQLECRIHGLEGNSRYKNRKTLHNLGSF